MNGRGSQKTARLERLKNEIIEYISIHPGCSAADIVDYLSNTRRMRNHGLTPRKVGFFISRNLAEKLTWWQDHRAGRRVYGDRSKTSESGQ